MIKTNWTNTVPMSLVGMATSTQATAKRKLTEPPAYDVCICQNCEYEETAFVAASGESYKNDKKSFIEKRIFSTDTITFKLMKAGAVVATLNASTYGTLYDFGDPLFLDFTDYKGFLVNWYLVKQGFGYGVYKIRTEIVSLGVTYTKDSHNFGVREYDSLRADGTVKIESYQTGNLNKYFDFTGLNWYQSTRIRGYFGHKTPTLVLNQMEDYQRRVHEIQSQIIDKYYMSTELLKSEIFNYLNYNGLRANTLLITDYNLQNQELYRQLEVYWSNIEEVTNHNDTRLANFVYEFKNRFNDDIKRNTKGDRGAMPYQKETIIIEVPTGIVPDGVYFQLPEADQYTSYRTGDVGWKVQNGHFPQFVNPQYPKAVAELDYTSANFHFLLKNNLIVNGVSSKTRFVDVDGGQTFSATSNKDYAVLDKLTGMLIQRATNDPGSNTWNTHIDGALTKSIVINGVTYSDWYLASFEEMVHIFGAFAYYGDWLDAVTSVKLMSLTYGWHWTATTHALDTTMAQAIQFDTGGMRVGQDYKTTNYHHFWIHKAQNLITAP